MNIFNFFPCMFIIRFIDCNAQQYCGILFSPVPAVINSKKFFMKIQARFSAAGFFSVFFIVVLL